MTASLVLLQEISEHGGHALLDRRASADREQFEVAVFFERDDGIGNTSGEVATLANLEPKLFVVALGLGEVTDSHADVIDAPTLPEKSARRRRVAIYPPIGDVRFYACLGPYLGAP